MKGQIFHVVNRGVEKKNIFFERSDYLRFVCDMYRFNNKESGLRLSKKYDTFFVNPPEQKKIVEILKWSLLPNHYHLLLQEVESGGVVEFVKRLGNGYTKYINIKNERSGYLFQNSAKIIQVIRDEHFRYLPFYIDANPVKIIEPLWKEKGIKDFKKITSFLESYKWSDYGNIDKTFFSKMITDKELFYKLFDISSDQYKKDFFEWLKNAHVDVAG